jgi:hypothetical protein
MMDVKTYYDKIEKVLASRKPTKTGKSSRKGLLSQSSTEPKPTGKEKNTIMSIVDIIEGIREAREEMTNAKK